ncbi:hypothetical protein J2Z44_003034 [Clostridium punense]|uniref:Uncharacterized protein n=1 Tax=Clostridium punense TaxID=1054297 RepID=A0ABS4K5Z1_9CLOT|nr:MULTISPECIES: hypothetical protein [Clostridium]EQB89768.1 hypothetical protein M918_19005 [Clostridium sp. BL8]MBP2023199.1 hypothetical protein [Clostridium punense]
MIAFEEHYYNKQGLNFQYMICDEVNFETYDIPELIENIPVSFNFSGEVNELEGNENIYLKEMMQKSGAKNKNSYKIRVWTSKQTIYIVPYFEIEDIDIDRLAYLGIKDYKIK